METHEAESINSGIPHQVYVVQALISSSPSRDSSHQPRMPSSALQSSWRSRGRPIPIMRLSPPKPTNNRAFSSALLVASPASPGLSQVHYATLHGIFQIVHWPFSRLSDLSARQWPPACSAQRQTLFACRWLPKTVNPAFALDSCLPRPLGPSTLSAPSPSPTSLYSSLLRTIDLQLPFHPFHHPVSSIHQSASACLCLLD
jgi:hypothetical protein